MAKSIKILFQGDSITDANRSRERNDYLGSGYPNFIAGMLEKEAFGKYEFINRGVSGNRVTDLLLRVKKDILDIEPDILSILIGVNDVWHEIEINDGVENEKFYKIYDIILDEVKRKLPNTEIILLEPFVLKGSATNKNLQMWNYFEKEVKLRSDSVKKLAKKYNAIFVPLQEMLENNQEKYQIAEKILRDGVHPTAFGAYLIAEEWLKKFLESRK